MSEIDLTCIDATNLEQITIIVVVAILFVERWLGKTSSVKAGSILEAAENIFKKSKKSNEGQDSNQGEWDGKFDDDSNIGRS